MADSDGELLRGVLKQVGGELPSDFAEFTSLFRRAKLRKGEVFVRSGEQTQALAFVTSGIARMFYTRNSGKEFNKGFVSAPEFMSALEALLTGSPTGLTIQALSPMTLLVAHYPSVEAFYERDMFWQRVGRRLIEQVYIKKVRREASLLVDTAVERYAKFLAAHTELANLVPDYHIAAYLGITPEALSRLKRAVSQGGSS